MHLKKLILTNFKNYELNELEFSPKINCFVGNNGVGKTNILDAIHYLSLTKSFFNSIDSISVRHGEDYFIDPDASVLVFRDDAEKNIRDSKTSIRTKKYLLDRLEYARKKAIQNLLLGTDYSANRDG